MTTSALRQELRKYASAQKAAVLKRFFKTGPGEYGEGDVFIGVKVPEIRLVARQGRDLALEDTLTLLSSPVHEERLLALVILAGKYEAGDALARAGIVKAYLRQTRDINNWDLVDLSCYKIVGDWLRDRDRALLFKLARSGNMWERRIAIVSTLAFIRQKDLADTFRIADVLMDDPQDLLHKAVGWMLREAGKRDHTALVEFLKTRYKRMPRTMLRYAIERFSSSERQKYLLK